MVSVHGQEGKTQMTNDLINRQQAIDVVMELIRDEWQGGVSRKICLLNAVYCALEDIPSAQPIVDAVPVIRCKDCIHYDGYYCHNKWWGDGYGNYTPPIKKEDGFCDWADRKGDDYETNR